MDLSPASAVWAQRIKALGDAVIRAHQLAGDLARQDPHDGVELLGELVHAAAQGNQDLSVFMLALREVLDRDLLPYGTRAEIYAAASQAGLTAVQRLFLAPPPVLTVGSGKANPRPPEGSDTLGMKTWMARTQTGSRLERLARDPDARVIANVLINPRLTQSTALRIAARRPVTASVLLEVARSPRWNKDARVRRALAFNPYTPVAVTLGFLPFLTRADLLVLSQDSRVHPEVRRQAGAILQLRPPTVTLLEDHPLKESS